MTYKTPYELGLQGSTPTLQGSSPTLQGSSPNLQPAVSPFGNLGGAYGPVAPVKTAPVKAPVGPVRPPAPTPTPAPSGQTFSFGDGNIYDINGNLVGRRPTAPTTPPPLPSATPSSLGLTYTETADEKALREAEERRLGQYPSSAPNLEESIKSQLARFQSEIDALNRLYAEKRAETTARVQARGNARLGSNRALQANSGMLGQVSGQAETDQINKGNDEELRQELSAVDLEKQQAMNAITGLASNLGVEEYKAKIAAYSQGLDATIENIKKRTERKQANTLNIVQRALAAGIDLSNSTEAQKIADSLGVTVDSLKQAYNDAKAQAEQASLKENIAGQDFALKQNLTSPYYTIGNVVYDAITRKPKYKKVGKEYQRIADGFRFSEPQQLFDDAGISSFEELQGLPADPYKFTEVSPGASLYDQYGNLISTAPDDSGSGNGSGLTPYQQFTATQSLRKELSKNTESSRTIKQQYSLMQEAIDRVKRGETKDLNATSQAIISTFNKILDPTSVVREGEYDRTAQGQSLINNIEGKIVRLQQGGAGLTLQSLQEIVNLGKSLSDSYASYAQQQNQIITENAQYYGIDPNLVVPGGGGGFDPDSYIDQVLNGEVTFNSAGNALASKPQVQPTKILVGKANTNVKIGLAKPTPLVIATAKKFASGSTGGQCTTFLHKIANFPPIGDGKNEKIASVNRFGIPAKSWQRQVRVGDIIVTGENKTYGHTAMVNAILPGGKIQLTESNRQGNEKVTYHRTMAINDPRIYGAIRGKLKLA